MKLILNYDNTIICICETVEEKNGLPYVAEVDTYFTENGLSIINMEEIPDYVNAGKYRYTKEKGFYENPDYVPSKDEEIESLRTQINELKEIQENILVSMLEV